MLQAEEERKVKEERDRVEREAKQKEREKVRMENLVRYPPCCL